jgi:hypothetical protein
VVLVEMLWWSGRIAQEILPSLLRGDHPPFLPISKSDEDGFSSLGLGLKSQSLSQSQSQSRAAVV